MNKINRIIFCIIDSVRSKHFFDLIQKGLLPNFKILMEDGIFSKNCVTDFPSITYPTQVSLITGTYTGEYRKELCHGVPLSDWMGRYVSPPMLRNYAAKDFQIYKINKDLGLNCQTILEMIDEGNTTSIAQFINRGADFFFPENKIKIAYYYLLFTRKRILLNLVARANALTVQNLLKNFRKPRKYFGNNEPPIASLLLFFTSDILCHIFGSDSKNYKLNLMHIDKQFGFLIRELDKMGYLDDTAIAIVSDHGNYRSGKIGSLTYFFERNGLTHYHPRKNLKGNLNIPEFAGVGFFNLKGINRTSHKYSWSRPTINELENYGPKRINLLEYLFKIKGSYLMYYRDDTNTTDKGIIHLKYKHRKTGKIILGAIEYRGKGTNYKTKYISENENNDAFGYANDEIASKFINNRFHSINEWLEGTFHLDYPIYPDLIPRHFKNPRSSDIIISTDGKIVYNSKHGKKTNDHKYSHDIGLRKCSIVPLIIGGSKEIPHKEIICCKITDIVPTLLKFLGKKPHKSIIGKSLI
ncbi:MAG: alkaline phosphatase family protein [Promethearchaeota archaeon]